MAERRKRNPQRQQSSNPGPSPQGRRGTVESPARPSEATGRESSGLLRAVCEVLTLTSRTPAGKPLDVQALLRTIGEAVDTDRVYLFRLHTEAQTNRRLATQTHEWVNQNISAQIDNPEMTNAPFDEMPADVVGKLEAGESAPLYRDDVEGFAREQMEKQDIQSMVFAPILTERGLWGFAGFDHCREVRHWASVERDALMALAGTISIAVNCNQL